MLISFIFDNYRIYRIFDILLYDRLTANRFNFSRTAWWAAQKIKKGMLPNNIPYAQA